MKPLMILILVAAVATGCGQAAAAGTRTPDAPTSHTVDPESLPPPVEAQAG